MSVLHPPLSRQLTEGQLVQAIGERTGKIVSFHRQRTRLAFGTPVNDLYLVLVEHEVGVRRLYCAEQLQVMEQSE